MFRQIFDAVEVRPLKTDGTNYLNAAGTGDTLKGDAVDTTHYAGTGFMLALGTVTDAGASYAKLQHSDTTTDGDFADIAGSRQNFTATGDSNKICLWSAFKPQKKYLRCVIVRATQNVVILSEQALLYRADILAVTQGSGVKGNIRLARPVTGTP
jgi:hypothetical protein